MPAPPSVTDLGTGPGVPGTVSVVVVNYKGADDTITCLQGFAELDWPADRLELVVVDNASGDDSVERIRAAVPHAKVIVSEVNTGFAGGCNLGVANATGQYVGFLNNDARPDPQWVRAAVEVLEHDGAIGAVASKVLDWDGRLIDYVDGSLTWYGMGYKREVERPDSEEYDRPKDVLFGTGAAMFVRTGLFRQVGGFDERFFMFYEDVDLGWRLNLLGHRVRYVPTSLAFHKHHQSMKRLGEWREHYLLERNALMTIYKNYDDSSLAKALPAAMALAVRRGIARGGDDAGVLDLQRGAGREDEEALAVTKKALAPAYAIDSFVDHLPTLAEDRRRLQAARRRTDKDLVPLFRQMIEPAYPHESYLAAHQAVVDAFGIEEHFSTRRRIVIATGEPLSAKMAGPAIRAWEIAVALSGEHDVRLVTLGACSITDPRFETASVSGRDLHKLEDWCDIFLFQGLVMAANSWLAESDKVLIADVYDPFHLEQLEQAKDRGDTTRRTIVRDCTTALNDQLTRGDFFLCASQKQRDFWLGQLSGLGRINADTYDYDESLDSLIAIVPFGVTDTPPKRTRPAIKGVVPGISKDDKVILWGGGIYNWFDPLTLIRAVDRLRHERDDVRLFFLGLKHPNPDVPQMRMAVAARDLADSLGLTGRYVFFNEEWVAYDDRQNYLLDADLGVSTHLQHVETQFSFRTRILDYLWAGLPIVATEGDTFGELIPQHGLGLVVPAEDVDALTEALSRLLSDEELANSCRAAIADYAPEATWTKVLTPLIDFCRAPRRAADLVDQLGEARLAGPTSFAASYNPTLKSDVRLLKAYLRQGGVSEVARRGMGRVKKRVRQLTAG
jgi:GT2 family glycosyltransferase/glycosyltransferase involved in cell wall biosynthesis